MTEPDQLPEEIAAQLRAWADDLASRTDPATIAPAMPRRRGPALLGVAASLALVGVLVAALTRPDAASIVGASTSTPDTTSASTTTAFLRPGDVAITDPFVEGAWSGARTDDFDRTVRMFVVGAAPYEPGNPCTADYTATVQETASEVRVAFLGRRPPGPAECDAVGHQRSIEVALDAPLGDRTLVALDKPRHVYDGSSLMVVTWLPVGWQQLSEWPGTFGSQTSATWLRTFGVPRPALDGDHCAPAEAWLVLTDVPASLLDQYGKQANEADAGHYDVHGVTAVLYTDAAAGSRRMVWQTGDHGLMLSAMPQCVGDTPPPVDTMVKFARSLRTP
ncbi:MAG: hypothetical protein RJA49_1984 [Actinomycetota bacterium]